MTSLSSETRLSWLMKTPSAVMPPAAGYDDEILHWPWKVLLERAADVIADTLPEETVMLDYMCGTGILLRHVSQRRPDLRLLGCDLDAEYIAYARAQLPQGEFYVADARSWQPPCQPNLISCTGGIHHLPPGEQVAFVRKLQGELPDNGWLLIGEELLAEYGNDEERIEVIRALYTDVFAFLAQQDAPPTVIAASLDVLMNDLLQRGEWKLTGQSLRELLSCGYTIRDWLWTWRVDLAVQGDAVLLCKALM